MPENLDCASQRISARIALSIHIIIFIMDAKY